MRTRTSPRNQEILRRSLGGATKDIATDLAATEAAMLRRRERYLADLMAGRTTRAKTTTYNAEQGMDAERRDELRRMLKAAGATQ